MGNRSTPSRRIYQPPDEQIQTELTVREEFRGRKYSLEKIDTFKVNQHKVVEAYIHSEFRRNSESQHATQQFAEDLVPLILSFYHTNCCEFYAFGSLQKYDKLALQRNNENLVSSLSDLCVSSKQLIGASKLTLLSSTGRVLYFESANEIYSHSLRDRGIEIDDIMTSSPVVYGWNSYIYCMHRKSLLGIGFDRRTRIWKDMQYGSLAAFDGLSRFFQHLNVSIKQIECGLMHTLFLTECGSVYSLGKNDDYECGCDSQMQIVEVPTKVDVQQHRIVSVAVGSLHSLCLDCDGNVWCFGNNYWAQLGIDAKLQQTLPIINSFFASNAKNGEPVIKKIVCGWRTSIVIDENLDCFVCGDNTNLAYQGYGQCGSAAEEKLFVPHKISGLLIEQASNSYNHTVMLSRDNKIYTMGNNEGLQCSSRLKDKSNITYPYQLSKQEIGISDYANIHKVVAMNNLTLIVTK